MQSRSIFKKAVALFLMLTLVAGMFNLSAFSLEKSGGNEETVEDEACPIYPKPQSMTYLSQKGVKLAGEVEVLVHGEHNSATLPKLEALLKENEISYSFVEALTGKAAIILAIDCKNADCAICSGVTDTASALDKVQGYTLSVSNAVNRNGQVTIVGADGNGAYYGVMSLRQLLLAKNKDGSILAVNVSDYPDVEFRGYIEGFYGAAWTNADRKSLFEDTSLYKMTTYVYAPKDDDYHRGKWRTLYPTAEANKLKSLIEVAAENNMTLCWTIHPGKDYNFTKDSDGNGVVDDFEALMKKLEQVYSLGVRQFGILFDDLPVSVIDGYKHAELITKAKEALCAKYDDILPFVTVSTKYANQRKAGDWNTYFKPFMQGIPEDTIVLWTGEYVMSPITKAYMEYPKIRTGIDMDFGVWWNYPVNDYCWGRMMMAPLVHLSNDVDNISSFFLNPMSEADASKVAIFSGADYSWNIGDFDAISSWKRAIKELVPEAYEAFVRFADNISGLDHSGEAFDFDESRYLQDDLFAFSEAMEKGEVPRLVAATLRDKFKQMLADVDDLKNIKNRALLTEISSHIDTYQVLAEAGILATNAVLAIEAGNLDLVIANYALLMPKLTYLETHKIKSANGYHLAYVGSLRILPLLKETEQYIQDTVNALLQAQNKLSVVSNNDTEGSASYADGIYFASFNQTTLNKNEYVGLRLPSVINVSTACAFLSATEGVKLQYSLNGVDWTDFAAEVNADGMQSTTAVAAAYIRILNGGDSPVSVSKLTAEQEVVVQNDLSITASTNTAASKETKVSDIVDGDLTTKYWTADKGAGSYVMFDLGAVASIDDVTLFSGYNVTTPKGVNALLKTVFEVSMDGETWTAVGEAHDRSEYRDLNDALKHSVLEIEVGGIQARYFRFVAPSNSDAEWVMYYEMICNANYVTADGEGMETQVSTSFDLTAANTAFHSIDNDYTTYIEKSSAGTAVGDAIVYDLGALTSIHDVEVYFGKNGTTVNGFAECKLQLSEDGATWTDMATLSSEEYLEKDTYFVAKFYADGSLARYIKLVATKTSAAKLQVYEINYNTLLAFMMNPAVGITTNMTQYKEYVLGYALDGDPTTKFYSDGRPKTPTVTLDYGRIINFYDVTITYGKTDRNTQVDGFVKTKIEVSCDGETWTTVATITKNEYEAVGDVYRTSAFLENVKGRYLRFSDADSSSTNWVQIYDILVNRAINTDTVSYAEGTAAITQVDNLFDNDFSTSAFLQGVKKDDTLILPITHFNDVESIAIWQSAGSTGATKLYVQKLDGEWKEIGALSQEANYFSVKDTIKAIKLVFDGQSNPEIQEIVTVKALTVADYSKVMAALGKIPANLSDYTAESLKVLENARLGCVEGYEISKQAEVDAMAAELEQAIAGLTLLPCVQNGHAWNGEGTCDVCGADDPAYVEPTTPTPDPDPEQSLWWVWVIVGALALASAAAVAVIVLKKRKTN